MNWDSIQKPTLLLNPDIARRNISVMAQKARSSGVSFRPHFKTHQSRQIGEWFRNEGVEKITVSSVEMAEYFAAHNWHDILIAFTANRREVTAIERLAAKIHLGLLFEDLETLLFFQNHLHSPADIWLEADNGSSRTGIPAGESESFIRLAQAVRPPYTLRGILTHAGNAYHAGSQSDKEKIYHQALSDLARIKQNLAGAGFSVLISYGDTPTLSRLDDLKGWDEIRPGNFVFYDSTQLNLDTCDPQDIAVGVACPVISVYPERGQLALYGGGVHLSKDCFQLNGHSCYGYVCLPGENGWGLPIPGAYVSGLWQEHAMVNMDPSWLKNINPGDLLVVLPSHSCMTVDLYDHYLTTWGEKITIKS